MKMVIGRQNYDKTILISDVARSFQIFTWKCRPQSDSLKQAEKQKVKQKPASQVMELRLRVRQRAPYQGSGWFTHPGLPVVRTERRTQGQDQVCHILYRNNIIQKNF